MKKIFLLFLVCYSAFAFAENPPIFEEETEETILWANYLPCSLPNSSSEEDNNKTNEPNSCPHCCDQHDQTNEEPKETHCFAGPLDNGEPPREPLFDTLHVGWVGQRYYFGFEKIFLLFPTAPMLSYTHTHMSARADDGSGVVEYSLRGYLPTQANIEPIKWFASVLQLFPYPHEILTTTTRQVNADVWEMDYTVYEPFQALVIKGRAIVTPWNAYLLECKKLDGAQDHFNYFLDHFSISL